MKYLYSLYYIDFELVGEPDELEEEEVLVYAGRCRDDSNSGGHKISTMGGIQVEYSSIIFAERNISELQVGEIIQVKDGDVIRLEGKVLRFSRDKYHCRIWV